MARRVRAVQNPTHSGQLPTGEWIPAHAVRFNSDGTTTVMVENRGRRRNVAAGWVEEETGIFHPIRASWDYDPRRSGERRPKGYKPKRGKKYSAASYRKKPRKRASAKRTTAKRRRR